MVVRLAEAHLLHNAHDQTYLRRACLDNHSSMIQSEHARDDMSTVESRYHCAILRARLVRYIGLASRFSVWISPAALRL